MKKYFKLDLDVADEWGPDEFLEEELEGDLVLADSGYVLASARLVELCKENGIALPVMGRVKLRKGK